MVPGRASKPLGEITLPVQFDTASNYRVEHINFYAADFKTAYHAILGRPAMSKFMVVLHYTYLVMKMPSPVGVLALRANLSIAYACETESRPRQSHRPLHLDGQCGHRSQDGVHRRHGDPRAGATRTSAKSKETKEVGLGLDDPSKTMKIGAHLDPK